MKYMIASDLHGSAETGKKLFERFDIEKPEKLILLGDLLYHGARNDLPDGYSTKSLAEQLNEHAESIICPRGNCDSEVDQMVLEFPMMADYLMMVVDGREWILTHGHLFNEYQMITHLPGTVLLHGHTHIKALQRMSDFYYVNPGSVTIPKDDGIRSYMIYEEGTFTIKDLEGRELRKMTLE